MKFTDSHCHLDFPELAQQLKPELADCFELAIERIIVPAVNPDNWQPVLEITSKAPSNVLLFPCLGIHPWYLNELTEQHLIALEQTAFNYQESIVAIGETGIDGKIAIEQNNMEKQKEFFRYQLELANRLNKPVIVHHRRSHNEVIEILKQSPVKHGGIIHAFSGSYQQGKTYIDMGFKLGIGGTITYERAKKTINAIKRFPVNALVLETDAPSMPLSGQQGTTNKPSNIKIIFQQLVNVLQCEPEKLAEQIEQNIDQLFFR